MWIWKSQKKRGPVSNVELGSMFADHIMIPQTKHFISTHMKSIGNFQYFDPCNRYQNCCAGLETVGLGNWHQYSIAQHVSYSFWNSIDTKQWRWIKKSLIYFSIFCSIFLFEWALFGGLIAFHCWNRYSQSINVSISLSKQLVSIDHFRNMINNSDACFIFFISRNLEKWITSVVVLRNVSGYEIFQGFLCSIRGSFAVVFILKHIHTNFRVKKQ